MHNLLLQLSFCSLKSVEAENSKFTLEGRDFTTVCTPDMNMNVYMNEMLSYQSREILRCILKIVCLL